jgi:hypothetical protein
VPRPARRLLAVIALAITLGAAGSLAVSGSAPASASESPDAPVAVAPEEGAFLDPGSIVLEWTAVDAPAGYEVSWANDEGGDAGTASVTGTSVPIEVEGGSYAWRVRVLPDGAWSMPRTFHADVQLETLPLPAEPAPAAAAARPDPASVPGGVWIGGALGFAVVFLVVVVIQSRLRREQDA